jgi:hypothetical protein
MLARPVERNKLKKTNELIGHACVVHRDSADRDPLRHRPKNRGYIAHGFGPCHACKFG